MDVRRWAGLVVATLLAAMSALPVSAAGTSASRLYLMVANTDYGYWSIDPADPELDVGMFGARCPSSPWTVGSKPCRQAFAEGVGGGFALDFMPASLLDEAPTWSVGSPLRFRLALEIDSPLPFSVHLQLAEGGGDGLIHTSGAATEVGPGVFEGTLGADGSLDPHRTNMLTAFVRTDAIHLDLRLHARGASWVELPEPVPARSVPQLLAQDTYEPAPTTFETESHSIRFNDADWGAFGFEGDLDTTREHPLDLPRDAAAVLAWVEVLDAPFTYALVREGSAEPDALTASFTIRLLRDGAELGHGSSAGERGRLGDSLAAVDVAAGPVVLEVEPADDHGPVAYRAHVLAVYGDRTLAALRARFAAPTRDVTPHARTPQAGVCQGGGVAAPIPHQATTVLVDLDWDSLAGPAAKWTTAFFLPGIGGFPCGEAGNGDRVRLTTTSGWAAFFGVAPSQDSTFVSYRDTRFELEVQYTYTAPADSS